MAELQFREDAAAGYDQAIGHMTRQLIPDLLAAGHICPGHRVLDIATGTGLAAEAVANVVGESGHVVAADISPAMLNQARDRLRTLRNISLSIEDGQSLTASNASFDAVICNMGLMYFPNALSGISEFWRVLRPGGHVAVTVYISPGRSMLGGVHLAIGRHSTLKAAEYWRFYSLGDKRYLRTLFEQVGFENIQITSKCFISFSLHSTLISAASKKGRGAQGRTTWRLERKSGARYGRKFAGTFRTPAAPSKGKCKSD